MMTQPKNKNGFTLIELLVVIAIIALLLAIVIPSMRKAKEYAKKILCKSNLHQIGIAIGNYEAAHSFNFRTTTKWYYHNGSGDMPWETSSLQIQPKAMTDVLADRLLPSREVFFCPATANASYKINYIRGKVLTGDVTRYATSDIEIMQENPANTNMLAMWGSYCYLWKKRMPDTIPIKDSEGNTLSSDAASINNVSSGAMFCDITSKTWARSYSIANDDGKMLRTLRDSGNEIKQVFPHFNVLMSDFSVLNPTDKDTDTAPEATQWLWNANTWAGL